VAGSGTGRLAPVLLIVLLGLSGGLGVDDAGRVTAANTGLRTVSQTERDDTAAYWTAQRMARTNVDAHPPAPDLPPGPTARTEDVRTATGPPAASPPPDTDPPAGQPFSGIAAVGALFSSDEDGTDGHYCTASVVHSPSRDLVLTAAHCVHDGADGDYQSRVAFVPGYHDGQSPYGVWLPTKMVVDPRWIASSDPDLDVAFLVVRKAGSAEHVEDVTGANRLDTTGRMPGPVRVTGYPNDADTPITCQNTVHWEENGTRPRFDCAAFTDGTSGAPWVVDADPRTQLGTVVGVIGGYQLGGDQPEVSYTPGFGARIQSLYDNAVRAAAQS